MRQIEVFFSEEGGMPGWILVELVLGRGQGGRPSAGSAHFC